MIDPSYLGILLYKQLGTNRKYQELKINIKFKKYKILN